MAATVTVTATTEVTFDEVRRRFSVDPANEQASNGCRSEEVESEVGFRRREEDYRHLGGYFDSLPSLDRSFPCFATRGTHPSPRTPALLELPKTVDEIAGNELLAGKVEETIATTKKATRTVLRGSCADSAGDEERIRGSDGDSGACGERRDAAKAREGRSTTVRCPPFSLCTNEGVTDCSR